VVVSSSAYSLERPDLMPLAVTSRVRPGTGLGECPVGHWQKAGLLKPSVVKPVVTAIEKNIALRKLGRLHEEDRRVLLEPLQRILGEYSSLSTDRDPDAEGR
jgi:mRNA interferase MazF